MTTITIANLRALLTADTGDFQSDMKTAGKTVKSTSAEMKKGEKSGKDFGKMFSSMAGKITAGSAAIATVGVTMKKAFDLGEAGAQVLQTEESFDLLLEKVGAAPDLLNQLQRASNGTIDKMSLMSATATLLAGTTGEFATELANATPELMAIAKAANKLNPALGTTAQMYDSIATGIKRGSPMILDNLGLTIKVGEANEKYAEQLGITVDAMSAEQKQMALLNDVMRAGNVLINQVGGSTVAATDNIARMEVALEDAGNAAKKKFAPGIADAADAVTLFLTADQLMKDAVIENARALRQSAEHYGEYKAGMIGIAQAASQVGIQVNIMSKEMFEALQEADDADRILGQYAQRANQAADATDDAADAQAGLNSELGETINKLDGVNTSLGNTVQNFKDQIAWVEAGGKELQDMTDDIIEMYNQELIDGDTALTALGDVELGVLDLEMELGNVTTEEAVEQLVEMGYPIDEATAKVNELQSTIFALKGKDVIINIVERHVSGGGITSTSGGGASSSGRIMPRAEGGYVSPGDMYLVGELGPELFVPDTAGNIVPNKDIGKTKQPAVVNHYTIHNHNEEAAAISSAILLSKELDALREHL